MEISGYIFGKSYLSMFVDDFLIFSVSPDHTFTYLL